MILFNIILFIFLIINGVFLYKVLEKLNEFSKKMEVFTAPENLLNEAKEDVPTKILKETSVNENLNKIIRNPFKKD